MSVRSVRVERTARNLEVSRAAALGRRRGLGAEPGELSEQEADTRELYAFPRGEKPKAEDA